MSKTSVKWELAYPRSPTAAIARSMFFMQRGWSIRGRDYAHTVTEEGWKGFRRYLGLAHTHLLQTKSYAAVDPRWYEAMLQIGIYESWPRADFDNWFAEAVRSEPGFYQHYFTALSYLLPKWHGDADEIERFARDAMSKSQTTEGFGMYARIYWYASQSQYQARLFKDSHVVWTDMSRGFEDVVAQYPDAWNLNNFARFACLAGDLEKVRELWKRAGDQMDPADWHNSELYGWCRQVGTS